MTPEQYAEARALFEAACDLPIGEQTAYLRAQCDDAQVREAVDRFLAIDREESAAGETEAAGGPVPDQIGPFKIVRVVGRGGMGVVYEARQSHPRRTVALKVINPGLATPGMLRRFAVEADVLGRLQHPGIAQIFDAATFDTGAGAQPYFVMELIDGLPLTQYVREHHLDTRDRLRLLERVCAAVQHAHQRGVIHRDLKPGNILVTRLDDGSPQPKILDFGVARSTDGDIRTTTMRTDVGQLVGTVAYMSPEQASGDPDGIDTRSDVYALGVLAYELLVGRLPYAIGDRMLHEAVRVIREEPPTRMSTIERACAGDIETIVGKALEKTPERRYQSAAELGADIEHYLKDEPIVARRPSTMYQLRKFAQRHRTLVGAAAAFTVLLIAATVVASVLAVIANDARHDAGLAATAADEARDEAERQSDLANLAAASASLRLDDGSAALARLERIDEARRDWTWQLLSRLADRSLVTIRLPGPVGTSLAVSPVDDTFAAIAGNGITIGRLDGTDDRLIEVRSALAVSFAPDGKRLAVAFQGGPVELIDLTTDTTTHSFEHAAGGRAVAISNDGSMLASVGNDGTVRVWLIDDESLLFERDLSEIQGCQDVAFAPDDTWLVVSVFRGGPRVVNLPSGFVRSGNFGIGRGGDIAVHADQRFANALAMNVDIRRGPAGDGTGFKQIFGPPGGSFTGVEWVNDATLAVTEQRGTLGYWDIGAGRPVQLTTLRGHASPIAGVARSADGSRIVTLAEDAVLKVWDANDRDVLATANAFAISQGTSRGLAAHRNDDAFWIMDDRDVIRRDVKTGAELARIAKPDFVRAIDISDDGKTLAVAAGSEVTLHDATTGEEGLTIELPEISTDLAFHTNGGTIATSTPNAIFLHRLADGSLVREMPWGQAEKTVVTFEPGGERLITAASGARLLRVYDTATGTVVAQLRHPDKILDACYGRGGALIATAGRDRVVRLWDAASGTLLRELRGHAGIVSAVGFQSDDHLVSTAGDGTVRVWDVDSGEELATLAGHETIVLDLVLLDRGRTIVTVGAGMGASIRRWSSE